MQAAAPTKPFVMPTIGNTARIVKIANRYIEGDGYSTKTAASFAQCEQRCIADQRCLAMEFYRPERKCNLFEAIKNPLASNDADVGIKQQ